MLSGICGLISMLVNIYGSKDGVHYDAVATAALLVTGGFTLICGFLTVLLLFVNIILYFKDHASSTHNSQQ